MVKGGMKIPHITYNIYMYIHIYIYTCTYIYVSVE